MRKIKNIKQTDKLRLKVEATADKRDHYKFAIEFYIFKEGGDYVAYCPSLDLTTTGEDYNDAIKNFYEMFRLYIETCVDHHTLETDLIAHGWKVRNESIKSPSFAFIMKKPEMKELMQGGIGFEKVVAPVSVPAL